MFRIPGDDEATHVPVMATESDESVSIPATISETAPIPATTNEAAPVPVIVTESDEESMVVVTPTRDYYITREKFVMPVQESCQSASAELVLSS